MNPKESLISGRLLAHNAIWNFGGLAAPMLVGLFAIPLLIDGMGKERFGLLAIIWMGVGYFSLFDMGLGRALTKLVAERMGSDCIDDLGPLIWTALFLIFGLALAGTLVVGWGAGPLVHHVLNVGAQFQVEAIIAFRILAIGLPAVIITTALIGLLAAHQRFATITAVRIPLGVLTFLGPLATVQFSPSLIWATAALLGARVLALVAYFTAAAFVRPELTRPDWPHRIHMRPLVQFGSWLTVTNIVSPLMAYFDRFVVGAIMSMTAVAYYVTPYEVLSRLQILPGSIMGVLFPALTTMMAGDQTRLSKLYGQTTRTLFLLMLPLASGLFLFAPEALQLWLGEEFRIAATPVAQWLALGTLVNALARLPLTVLQSAGHPDLVAKTHLLELIPYVAILWILTQQFGIAGTAAAWFLRVLADTIILNELTRRKLPDLQAVIEQTHMTVAGLLVGFFLGWLAGSLIVRVLLFLAVAVVSWVLLWPTVKSLRHAGQRADSATLATEPTR